MPATLALTLAASYLFGYTLNRVTLFALIFAIGILVDDAIVVVENIHRHYQLGWTNPRQATVYATDEVGNPTILATFTVIAALLPLAFVSGLMGPYMRPIPINASAAMLFSLIVAFVVSPWLTFKLFRQHAAAMAEGPRPARRRNRRPRLASCGVYTAIVPPLIGKASATLGAPGRGGGAAAAGSMGLVALRVVKVKMLPVRQQERVPGRHRHARGQHPRRARPASPSALADDGAHAARGDRHPDLRGHLGPVQLQRPGSALLPAAGRLLVADLQVNLLPKHHRDAAEPPLRQGAAGPAGARRRRHTTPTSR